MFSKINENRLTFLLNYLLLWKRLRELILTIFWRTNITDTCFNMFRSRPQVMETEEKNTLSLKMTMSITIVSSQILWDLLSSFLSCRHRNSFTSVSTSQTISLKKWKKLISLLSNSLKSNSLKSKNLKSKMIHSRWTQKHPGATQKLPGATQKHPGARMHSKWSNLIKKTNKQSRFLDHGREIALVGWTKSMKVDFEFTQILKILIYL